MSDKKYMNRKARRRNDALARSKRAISLKSKNASSRSFLTAGAISLGAAIGVPQASVAQTVVPPANGPCDVAGTTAICTGDLSAGVEANGPTIDTLNINSVTAPGIAPAAGVPGVIFLTPSGDVNINADTSGTSGIATTGDAAQGIAANTQGSGDVSVTSVGDISTDGNASEGIFAVQAGTDGDVTVDAAGQFTTLGDNSIAVRAQQNNGNGNIQVGFTGSISTTGDQSTGIQAQHNGLIGNVAVTSNGSITTQGESANGILAQHNGESGDITVQSTGNIATTDADSRAIVAQHNGADGSITVNSNGNLSTQGANADGIFAIQNNDAGDITVNSVGNITTQASDAEGINAAKNSGDGNITVSSTGNISAGGVAVFTRIADDGDINLTFNGNTSSENENAIQAIVDGSGNITASNTGNVTADDGDGIILDVDGTGDVVLNSIGNIIADGDGIDLSSGTGSVTIFSQGDISVTNGEAIEVDVDDGDITVTSVGNLTTADGDGSEAIELDIDGDGNIFVRSTGDITADQDGIELDIDGDGNITIISVGNVTANSNDGLEGDTTNGNVSISSIGNVSAEDNGFEADVEGDGNIVLQSMGDVTSTDGSGFDASIDGSGDISITSDGSVDAIEDGIFALIEGDGNVTVSAAGAILSEEDAVQVNLDGDGNIVVNNSAEVEAADTGLSAFVGGSGNVSLTNSGSVTSGFDGLFGEVAGEGGTGNITIVNTGTVDAQGTGLTVQHSGNGQVAITNTGEITAVEEAIRAGSNTTGTSPVTITNSGVLTGGNGFSINLEGDSNDTVTLMSGSLLNGAIDFGNGNDGLGGTNPNDVDTLNFSSGLNAVVDFADASGGDNDLASAPEIINFGGAGAVVNGGLTAIAVDTTGFTAQATVISDITDAIFNSLEAANRVPSDTPASEVSRGFGDIASTQGPHVWISLLGGDRDVEAEGSNVGFEHSYGGLIGGAESTEIVQNGSLGFLAGLTNSSVNLDDNAGETDVTSYFGGVYWERGFDGFRLNAALVAGFTDNETSRTVGTGEAEGDFDGTFVSPSLAFDAPITQWETPLTFSARANYVYLRLDDYTETGTGTPLTVEDRDVSLFNTRAQVNLPKTFAGAEGGKTDLNLSVGVDATFDAGSDDVEAIAASTPFAFVADFDDAAAGFLGLDVAYSSEDGLRSVGFNTEVQSTFDGGYGVTAEFRATFRF